MGNYTFEHLNSINLMHYSQVCSNCHLCKITNAESTQANCCPTVTVQDDHLSTATTFFDSQMKKNLSKTTTTKLYPVKEFEKKKKEQCVKNKRLSDYIYPNANL